MTIEKLTRDLQKAVDGWKPGMTVEVRVETLKKALEHLIVAEGNLRALRELLQTEVWEASLYDKVHRILHRPEETA